MHGAPLFRDQLTGTRPATILVLKSPPPLATSTHPKRALGVFIRACRERLAPPSKPGVRRRTPGWRREELADAAGLGVTWITWLEQGREVNASVAALARLADALQLTPAERTSMFDLAGKRDPHAPAIADDTLPPELLRLPELIAVPAYLLDHCWNARAWNDAAAELFGGWLDKRTPDRNLLRFVFLSPRAQTLIVDWPERARRLVAEFHADFNRHPGDHALQALVEELAAHSQPFAQHWSKQEVLAREGGGRRFRHPRRGELHFLQTTLLVAAQPTVKLVCLQPQARARRGRNPAPGN